MEDNTGDGVLETPLYNVVLYWDVHYLLWTIREAVLLFLRLLVIVNDLYLCIMLFDVVIEMETAVTTPWISHILLHILMTIMVV